MGGERASRATSARGTTPATARRRAREKSNVPGSVVGDCSHQTVGDSRRRRCRQRCRQRSPFFTVSPCFTSAARRGAACHRRSGSVAVVADPVGRRSPPPPAAARRLFEPPFESASSSRRFCSAPGPGRAASSMTTVNASASASPSTRYANGVAQLPPSPPRAGGRDRSRYMAHSHAKRLWFGRVRRVSNGALVVQVHVLDDEVPAAQQQRRLAGTSTPRWSFVVITLSWSSPGSPRSWPRDGRGPRAR